MSLLLLLLLNYQLIICEFIDSIMFLNFVCYLQILPHPSYVYCCAFVMNYCGIITGCFDTIIRVWIKLQGTNSWELLQELTDHNGYVNIVCTLSDTEFCSGDSLGVIIRWSYVSERLVIIFVRYEVIFINT